MVVCGSGTFAGSRCDERDSVNLRINVLHDLYTFTSHFSDTNTRSTMEQEIDGWIEQLSSCKQLPEADVKKLCDKVSCPRLLA
jgi:hypothetical protein